LQFLLIQVSYCPNENIGIVENKGIELELTHTKHLGREFYYTITGNVSYARNKVIDISEPKNVPEWQKSRRSYP